MPQSNLEWEDQIKGYRKNRLLLVAKSLHFGASTAAVETAIRARLTKPDSVTLMWPPGATSPNHHKGWVMLVFSGRPDTQMALGELQNLEIRGRAVNVERASRGTRPANASYEIRAARNSASAAITSTATTADTAATAATVSIVTTVDVPVRHAPVPDAATRNSSRSVDETPLTSQGVWEWQGTGDAGSSFEIALPEILGDFDAEWEVESQDD
ncbi:hypothetical protein ACHAPE_006856 [Trichoderma viride]